MLNKHQSRERETVSVIGQLQLTLIKCLLTHLVKAFFWMASRSSTRKEEEEDK